VTSQSERSRRDRVDLAVAATVTCLVTGLALLQLFFGPDLGLADNGDGRRVLCAADLQPAPLDTAFVDVVYAFAPLTDPSAGFCDQDNLRFSSSQVVLVHAVRLADELVSGAGLDLRLVGAAAAGSTGLAIGLLYLLLPGRRLGRLTASVGVAAVVLDVAYAHYWSTAYSETAGFLGLLWTGVALAWTGRRGLRPLPVLATVLAAAFMATAKSQLAPLAGIVLVLLVVRWLTTGGQSADRARRLGLVAVAGVALLGTAAAQLAYQGPEFHRANIHNLTLYTLLPLTDDPAQAMRDLGQDPALARYAGSTAFDSGAFADPGYPGFTESMSRLTVARYLLEHPGIAVEMVQRGLEQATQPRTPYLAEVPIADQVDGTAATGRWDLPSRVLEHLEPVAPVFFPVVWLALLAWGVLLLARPSMRERGSPAWGLPLLLCAGGAVAQVAVALVGDGFYELAKHEVYVGWLTGVACALAVGSVLALRDRDRAGERPPTAVAAEPA
jgi:hypothetical protein